LYPSRFVNKGIFVANVTKVLSVIFMTFITVQANLKERFS